MNKLIKIMAIMVIGLSSYTAFGCNGEVMLDYSNDTYYCVSGDLDYGDSIYDHPEKASAVSSPYDYDTEEGVEGIYDN